MDLVVAVRTTSCTMEAASVKTRIIGAATQNQVGTQMSKLLTKSNNRTSGGVRYRTIHLMAVAETAMLLRTSLNTQKVLLIIPTNG